MCIRRSPGRPAPWGRIYPSTSTHRFPPGRRKRTSCREQETTATHQKQTRKSRTERGKVARLDGVKGVCCCCCCVFVPSILATVPPIKARRALENCTGSVHFSVQLQLPGVTQEGGFFLLALVFFAPPSSCDACLHFSSREGFGRLYPSSTPEKSNFVYSRSFSAINRFPLPGTGVRKKTLSPRFEPVT